MSHRERARRRFLRRWSLYYGRADAVRIWNGDIPRTHRVLGGPTRIDVRPTSHDGPWFQ